MEHHQIIRKEPKDDKIYADQLSTAKPSISHNTNSIEKRFGKSNKPSDTQRFSLRNYRANTGGISAMDAYELGIKTTDFRGKERNWAILGFEAAMARARDAKYERPQQITASKHPVKILLSPTSADKCWDSLEGCSSDQTSALKQPDKIISHPSKNKAKKERVGYFSLPGEIRNMIMGYLFRDQHPDQIFLTSNNQAFADNSHPTLGTSGWQFLATCYQAYIDACGLYTFNEFHLAPGPLSASTDCFKDWDPGFQRLVRNVTMYLSILDLTPAFMNCIETAFYENCGSPIGEADNKQVAHYVRNALQDLLIEKIAGVRRTKAVKSLRLVRILLYENDDRYGDDNQYTQFAANTVTIHSHQWSNYFGRLDTMDPKNGCSRWGRPSHDIFHQTEWHPDIRIMLSGVLHSVEPLVTRRLRWGGSSKGRAGWASLKLWLERLQVSTDEST